MSKGKRRRPVKKSRGVRPTLAKVLRLIPLFDSISRYLELLLKILGIIS